MKHFLAIFLTIFIGNVYGQSEADEMQSTLDSLKNSISEELPMYGKTKRTASGLTWHSIIYFSSPMFIIESKKGTYTYRFISASDSLKVDEFINEYFKPEIIKTIVVADSAKAILLYGSQGMEGVVTIHLKTRAKFNPKVAGLTKVERRKRRFYGDNYAF